MQKFSIFTKNLFLAPPLQDELERQIITTDLKSAPGQLRKKGDWYYLTILRIVKIKNFNSTIMDLEETEINCTRVTLFQIKDNKLLLRGTKSEHKDVKSYFDALVLKLIGSRPATEAVDPANITEAIKDYLRIDDPIIDLGLVVERLETASAVADIKKLRMKKVEIAVGNIQNCIVNTCDYGGVRKIIGEDENAAFGIEILMKEPAETLIYCDLDGQVRVMSKNDDVDIEQLAVGCALKLC